MNKVISDETPHLKVLNQYIKDLSYENTQKNGETKINIKDNNTSIDINVIYKPFDEEHFGVSVKILINCKSKKSNENIFYLELDYFGFFEVHNIRSFKKDQLTSEGAKIIFPFARSIIANISQNGGNIPIILDNVDFKLIKT